MQNPQQTQSAIVQRFQEIKRQAQATPASPPLRVVAPRTEQQEMSAIIADHLRQRGMLPGSAPETERVHPVAQRLSEVLYAPETTETERVRLEQIVSLVLADRRRS